MKTYWWPLRTCTASAVLTTSRGLLPRTLAAPGLVLAAIAPRGAKGSTGCSTSSSAGSTSGSDDNGRRRATGESPPTPDHLSRRIGHGLDFHSLELLSARN